MKGSMGRGGGGSFQKNLKTKLREIKDQIKKSTRNLKVGACGFILYYYDHTIF